MTPQSLVNNFDLLTTTPNAVAKLRQAILELAARGQLVPQWDGDEPARVLADRISSRFEAMRRDGLMRLDVIDALDKADLPSLPPTWEWVRLGNVVDYGSADKADSGEIPGNSWLLDLEDVEKDTSRIVRRRTFAESPSKSTKAAFQRGDVLYGKLRPYLNKVLVADAPGFCTTEIIPIRTHGFIEPRYLCYALKRPTYVAYAVSKCYGMNLPRLSTEDARLAPFPLPPLAEQKRIVAKVDEFMALCDRLEAQQQQREHAHAVLSHAALARFADAPTVDNLEYLFAASYPTPPSDLRASILATVVGGAFAADKSTTAIRLRDVIVLVSGRHLQPDSWNQKGDGIPYLTGPADFGPKHPVATRWTTTPEAVAEAGDILVTVKGAGVGKTNILDAGPVAISRQLMAVRVTGADPAFVHLVLQHAAAHFQSVMTGIAIPGIGRSDLLDLELALPPLTEQRRVVAKVNELMALVDRLEADLAAARATGEKLMDAVVAELTAAG